MLPTSAVSGFYFGHPQAEYFGVARIGSDGAEIADDMERLTPLSGVHEFPSRVKCAVLAWHTLEAALKGEDARPVSTE